MKFVISILFLMASLPAMASCFPGTPSIIGGCDCPPDYRSVGRSCVSTSLGGSFNFNQYQLRSPRLQFNSPIVIPTTTITTPAPVVTPTPVPGPASTTDSQRDPASEEVTADPATAETEAPEVPEAPIPPVPAVTSSQDNLADTFASYDPATCNWTQDLPRKLHSAPGCTRSSSNRICVGYVVCNAREGGGKFVRTATCSAENCGNSEAAACASERSFYSQVPEENVGKYMSDRVKQTVIGQ